VCAWHLCDLIRSSSFLRNDETRRLQAAIVHIDDMNRRCTGASSTCTPYTCTALRLVRCRCRRQMSLKGKSRENVSHWHDRKLMPQNQSFVSVRSRARMWQRMMFLGETRRPQAAIRDIVPHEALPRGGSSTGKQPRGRSSTSTAPSSVPPWGMSRRCAQGASSARSPLRLQESAVRN
jgi:hypothetical protein